MDEEETPMKLYRNAGILILVLALLFGIYYAVSNRKPEEKPADETITIFKTEKDNIAEMHIMTQDEDLVFIKDGEDWTVKGKEDIALVQSKIDSLAYDIATIHAEQVVEEEAADLAVYGLDQPAGTVNITLTDGTTKTFLLGDATPSKTQYYFMVKDAETVYTVYSYKGESFLNTLDQYRDQTIFTLKPEEINGFTIEGKNRDKIVVKEKGEKAEDQTGVLSTWDILEPTKGHGSNEDIHEMILAKLPDIKVKEFVEDEDENLGAYGLDEPNYRIQFTDKNNRSIALLLGNRKDDMIYLKVEGKASVYLVDSAPLAFKDVDVFNLMEKFAYLVNIDLVDRIVINTEGKQSVMEIIHNPDEEKEDDYKINGQKADESPFKKMYQEVIGLIVDGDLDDKHTGKVEGTPDLSYTFYHNNDAPPVSMEYIGIGDRHYAVVKNGKSEHYILKKKVNKMIERLEAFEQNPTEKEE